MTQTHAQEKQSYIYGLLIVYIYGLLIIYMKQVKISLMSVNIFILHDVQTYMVTIHTSRSFTTLWWKVNILNAYKVLPTKRKLNDPRKVRIEKRGGKWIQEDKKKLVSKYSIHWRGSEQKHILNISFFASLPLIFQK